MDYEEIPICKNWKHDRERHPFFGENFSKEMIFSCWDRSAEGYTGENYSQIRSMVISDLIEMKVLDQGSVVLDIGCGPGLFALPFADHVKKVYCVDSSIPMIDRLVSKINNSKIDNMEVRHSTWEDLEVIPDVDVIFSSLCPPFNNPEDIMRMEDFASSYCVYISSANEDKGMNLEIWRRIGKDYSFNGYNTRYPCEFLISQGRVPELRFYSETLRTETTVDKAISSELSKIAQYRDISSEIEDIVTDVVMMHQSNGMMISEQEMRLGMLIWKPIKTQ